MPKADVKYIIEWYLISKLRNPYYVNAIKHYWDKIYDRTIEIEVIESEEYKYLESIGIDYKILATELKRRKLSDFNHDKKFHLIERLNTSFQDNQPVKETLAKMLTMNVTILEAGESDYFIVTDNPGFTGKRVVGGDAMNIYNADFSNFNQVFIPINSKQAILFEDYDPISNLWDNKHLRYESIPSEVLRRCNQASLMHITSKAFYENR